VEVFDINASLRDVQGKGASRRLRRAGQVPGVVYGGGKDPVNIQFQHNDLYQTSSFSIMICTCIRSTKHFTRTF